MSLANRLSNAWNAFMGRDSPFDKIDDGLSYPTNPDRIASTGRSKQIITPIFNKIATDVANLDFRHVYTDPNERYIGDVPNSSINEILQVSSNLDQLPFDLVQDAVFSMLEEGCVAVCPVDADLDPSENNSFKIYEARVGKIVEWKPSMVYVNVYDQRDGQKKDVWFKKETTVILNNPFFEVMNSHNSTLQRLMRKMALLDKLETDSASGRLDLLIQLPYSVKSETRREGAKRRRDEIEQQLTNSKYGIAYIDGTEKVTQLNRPIENTLPEQVNNLIEQSYSELGMTKEILNGSASPDTMSNYYARIVEVIANYFISEVTRKWLTPTARTQGQRIMYFRDYFKLMTIEKLADTADKFTRNAIMSSNEFRQRLGLKPSDDPDADTLRNKNLNAPEDMTPYPTDETLVDEHIEEPSSNDGYSDDDYGFH